MLIATIGGIIGVAGVAIVLLAMHRRIEILTEWCNDLEERLSRIDGGQEAD